MVMAENARTGFVWKTFMKNPEAQRGMERAGFKSYQPCKTSGDGLALLADYSFAEAEPSSRNSINASPWAEA